MCEVKRVEGRIPYGKRGWQPNNFNAQSAWREQYCAEGSESLLGHVGKGPPAHPSFEKEEAAIAYGTPVRHDKKVTLVRLVQSTCVTEIMRLNIPVCWVCQFLWGKQVWVEQTPLPQWLR